MKPSKPRCYAEGPTQEGKDIVLRCLSSEGTIPLQYSWEKTSDSKLLPASAVLGNGPFHTSTHKHIKNRFLTHRSSCWCVYNVFFPLQILWQAPLMWGMHLRAHLAPTAALPAIVLAPSNVYWISTLHHVSTQLTSCWCTNLCDLFFWPGVWPAF